MFKIGVLIVSLMMVATQCFALSDSEFDQLYNGCGKFRSEVDRFRDIPEGMPLGSEDMKLDDTRTIDKYSKMIKGDIVDKRAKVNMSRGFTRCYAYAEAIYWLKSDMYNSILNKHDPGMIENFVPLDFLSESYEYDHAMCIPTYAFHNYKADQVRRSNDYADGGERLGGLIELDVQISGNLHQIRVGDGRGNEKTFYYLKKDNYLDREGNSDCKDTEPHEGQFLFFDDIYEMETPKTAKDFGEKNPVIKVIRKFNSCFC